LPQPIDDRFGQRIFPPGTVAVELVDNEREIDSQGQPPQQRSVETNNWQDSEKLGLDWSRVCSAFARSGSRSQKPTLRTGPFPQVKLKIEARNTT
jgi:hypothetical protein